MARDDVNRPRFDVYAMLCLLSFLMLGGACYTLYTHLNETWGFKFGDPDNTKRATHLTEMHEVGQNTPYIVIRKVDLEDWNAIAAQNRGGTFPVKDYEWPEGYDPYKFPILPFTDNLGKMQDPADGPKWKEAFDKLMSRADKEPVPEAPKAPEAPKTPEAPKAPDAPKDAPKADAPKADATKADATKADAQK